MKPNHKPKKHLYEDRYAEWQQLFEHSLDLVFILDLDYNFLFTNERALKILGYTKKEILGKKISELYTDQYKKLEFNPREVIQKQKRIVQTIDFQTRDGKFFTFRCNISGVYEKEKLQFYLAIQRDITEKKALSYTLQKERNFIDAVINIAETLIIVLDKKGHIIKFNKSCEKLSGYSFYEVQRKSFIELLIPSDDKKRMKKLFKDLVRGNFPNQVENYWITKNHEKKLISWKNTCLVDSFGDVQYIIGTGIDITKKREIENNLKLHSLLLNSANDAIILSDLDGRIEYANESTAKLFNINTNEIVGANILSFQDSASKQKTKQIFEMIKEKREMIFEREFIDIRGHSVSFETHSSVIKIGETWKVLSILRDITERKRITKQLEFQANMLQNALDSIFVLDSKGDIIYANKMAYLSREYTKEEFFKMNIKDLTTVEYSQIVDRRIKEILNKGKLDFESKHVSKLGKELYVDIRARTITVDESEYILSVARDITSIKILENLVQEEQKLFNLVIDNAEIAIIGIDENYNVFLFNKYLQNLTNLSKEDVLGKSLYDLHPKHQIRSSEHRSVVEMVNTGLTSRFPLPIHTNEGMKTILYETVRIKRQGKDNFIFLGIDISFEKENQQKMEKLFESIKSINRILRHDLNNFLAIIEGTIITFLELDDKDLLIRALNATENSFNLIQKMAELEESIKQNTELLELDARKEIDRIVSAYKGNYIQIKVEGEGNVKADEAFSSVIDNIISNAIDRGKADNIEITINAEEKFTAIEIADNGIGIPEETKSKIFEEGYKSRDSKGSGLGLYIVRNAMDKYKGKVEVVDNNPKGTIFRLIFGK